MKTLLFTLSFLISFNLLSTIVLAEVNIDLNKEVDLYALSQNYPRCTNTIYRHECYDIARGKGFSLEGYWKNNGLWDGVYIEGNSKEILYKYFNGTRVYVGSMCSKSKTGWYLCSGGTKYKLLEGGKLTSDGKIEGKVIIRFASGNVFEGNMKNNLRNGYGKMFFETGNVYEGNWLNGSSHGYGKLTFSNGDIHEGNYKNGSHHGFGKIMFANGKVEEGIWENGKFMYAQKPTSTPTSKIEGYKSFCSEIGFTPGTEKFGECVVEAMKKG